MTFHEIWFPSKELYRLSLPNWTIISKWHRPNSNSEQHPQKLDQLGRIVHTAGKSETNLMIFIFFHIFFLCLSEQLKWHEIWRFHIRPEWLSYVVQTLICIWSFPRHLQCELSGYISSVFDVTAMRLMTQSCVGGSSDYNKHQNFPLLFLSLLLIIISLWICQLKLHKSCKNESHRLTAAKLLPTYCVWNHFIFLCMWVPSKLCDLCFELWDLWF